MLRYIQKYKKSQKSSGRPIVSQRKNKFSSGVLKISRTLSLDQINRTQYNSIYNSDRAQTHSLTTHRRRVGLFFGIVLLFIVLIYFVINQITANYVVLINTKDTINNIDKSIYEQALIDYSKSNTSSRIRSLLNNDSLSEFMLENYPEIQSVNDSGKLDVFGTSYRFTFRKPVAKWQVNQNIYYVDSSGIPFEKNYFDEPTLNVVDNSGIKFDKGEAIASNKFLRFVGRVVTECTSRGYVVVEATIPTDTTRQLNIKLKGRVTTIKLAVDRDIQNQVEDMNNAFLYLDSRSIYPEYIDVRINGKAYYK